VIPCLVAPFVDEDTRALKSSGKRKEPFQLDSAHDDLVKYLVESEKSWRAV
jgi:hypothetical protein